MKKIINSLSEALESTDTIEALREQLKDIIFYYDNEVNLRHYMNKFNLSMNEAKEYQMIRDRIAVCTEQLKILSGRDKKDLKEKIEEYKTQRRNLVLSKRNTPVNPQNCTSGHPTYVLKLMRYDGYTQEDAYEHMKCNAKLKQIRERYKFDRKLYAADEEYKTVFMQKKSIADKYKA